MIKESNFYNSKIVLRNTGAELGFSDRGCKLLVNCVSTSGAVQFVQNWVRNSLYSPKKWVRKICSFLT